MLSSAINSGLRNETALSSERIDVRPQRSGYWTRTAALLAALGWDVRRNKKFYWAAGSIHSLAWIWDA